jgi:hypothetical protein
VNKKQNKIAIVVVYFGIWPAWISYFIYSLSKNPLIDFIIFSNSSPLCDKYTNITFYKQTLDNLCSLIHSKLGIRINIKNPYKLCDFKPTYGVLFEDYLKPYDYWGYCDIDLLFSSKMQDFVLSNMKKFDVLLGYKDFASGPFALFRNIEDVNRIFTQATNYKMKLASPSWYGFDEHIIKPENVGFSFKKMIYLLLFIMRNPGYLLNYTLLKFYFQWYYKRITVKEPVDLSEVLYLNRKKGNLNVEFCSMVTNDTDYVRNRVKNWVVYFYKGKLFNQNYNELLIFHFGQIKKQKEFRCELTEIAKTLNISINENGIKVNDE